MIPDRYRPTLTIDLDAIAANYRRLRDEASDAEVAGVVKADGYGLGAVHVARALRKSGCRTFFVATLSEAVELRRTLPDAAILVLGGIGDGSEAAFREHDLVPVLNNPGELGRWSAFARKVEERLPAALHIDTGMCRLGFDHHGADAIDRAALAALDLRLVMSHLACAEEREHPLNRRQLARFAAYVERFPGGRRSLANSSGIFLGAGFHFDLCRPGVALYGVNPTPASDNPMRPVVSLHAPILQIHEVDEPGTVGYGATCATSRGTRIATVPVGYADGILRSASNRAVARIDGHEAEFAGRVSMDLITLDVTGLPPDVARPGAAVELIGGPDGVDRLAEAAETIGYEVLTRLGTRFERRYLGGGA